MFIRKLVPGLGLALVLSACAQQTPGPIYAEPVFDKYGNPSCRAPDQPITGAYTVDLPICEMLSAGTTASGASASTNGTTADGTVVPVTPVVDPGDPTVTTTPPYQYQGTGGQGAGAPGGQGGQNYQGG